MAGEGGVDLATLGLRVDARPMVEAAAATRDMAAAGERAERVTKRFITLAEHDARLARRRAQDERVYAQALRERSQTERQIIELAHAEALAMDQAAAATGRAATSSVRAGAGLHRLNNSLVVLARQATGTHPIIGQLTDVIGTFAIGTARMVPILAGIAAAGFGIRKLAEEARNARAELDKQLKVLRDIANERGIEGRGGATQIAVDAAQAESRRLATLLQQAQNLGNQALVDRYTRQLGETNLLIAAGRGVLGDEARDERARQRREQLRIQQEVEAASQRHQDRLTKIEKDAEAERARNRRINLASREREAAQAREREEEAEAQRARDRRIRLADRERQAEAEAARRREAEQEHIRAQERANRALVQALENVGRAYGGVADQVLALVAAAISLERMPLATGKDRARAFGSAALTGIGYGATTGSPALGGLGGGLSGFALAGPRGAIIGAVSGVVSGLIESGRRAREAQRIWDRAFRDFRNTFRTPTLLESDIERITDQFEDLRAQLLANAGGFKDFVAAVKQVEELERVRDDLIKQARERAAAEQGQFADDIRVRLLRARGLEDEANALQLQIEQERELARARELGFDATTLALLEQVHAQERLAQAAKETNDAVESVIQALNSPHGLNLALYGYRAGLIGGGLGGGGNEPYRGGIGSGGPIIINGDMNVNVTGGSNPRETADEVIREVYRRSRLGAGNPLAVSSR